MIIDLTKSSALEITPVSSEQQPSRMCRSLWSCGGCSLVFDPGEGCCPRCGHSVIPTACAAKVCPPEYEEFNWDAHNDWVEFRNAKAPQPWSREDAILIVRAALLDEHMRTVLKQCSCRAIRPDVVKIIDNLEVLFISIEAMDNHFIEAAARIVGLDSEERSRRKAEHD